MYERHEIGKKGEEIACKYLENIGYNIINKNFECRQGEIDIIAKDGNELVFIEVKTRTNIKYGEPIEAVTTVKRKHIEKATSYYLYINNIEEQFIRVDVVEIYITKNMYKINHIKQII